MNNEEAMQLALDEARAALIHHDVPVGAVIVRGGEVIARAHNQREMLGDPTAHAEVIAIRQAAATVGSWRLTDCTLFVTLEPCVMCGGAIVASRLPAVVYGATDPKAGATGSLYNVCADPRLNHEPALVSGVLADECGQILRDFFAARRQAPTEL